MRAFSLRMNKIRKRNVAPLVKACFLGKPEQVKELLDGGAEIAQKDVDGRTAVFAAAHQGQVEVMEVLISNGVKLGSEKDRNGSTPLHVACVQGHEEVVKFCLDNGIDKNVRDRRGRPPIHAAASNGFDSIVRILIEAGADVNATDNKGVTPLMLASFSKSEACTALLLERGADLTSRDRQGRNVLHWAAYYGDEQIFRLLLSQPGADTLAWTAAKDGVMPLHAAAASGSVLIVRQLLETAGATGVNAADKKGRTCVYYAAGHNHMAALLFLLDEAGASATSSAAGADPFLHAVAQGHCEIARVLLAHGGDVTRVDDQGRNAVHIAAMSGHAQCLRELVQGELGTDGKGLSTEALDTQRRTPLHFAASRGHVVCVDVLLELNASPAAVNDDGLTPLFGACLNAHATAAASLLAAHADVNSRDDMQRTPLHAAARRAASPGLIDLLVDAGADLHAVDVYARNALHFAVASGDLDSVEYLCELVDNNKEVLEQRDTLGRTPMILACRCGHAEMVQELYERGADVNAADSRKMTAAHYGAMIGRREVLALLKNMGATMNVQDRRGRTPLLHAVLASAEDCLDVLLDSASNDANVAFDLEACDQDGVTPLLGACRMGSLEMVETLLEKNVDLGPRTKAGTTAIFEAVLSTDPKRMAQLGLEEVDEDDADEASSAPAIVQWLVECGADVDDTCPPNNWTALHLACSISSPHCVAALLECGVNVNAVDKQGRSALHICAEKDATSCLEVLVPRNPDFTIKDDSNRTAKEIAEALGNDEAAALLKAGEAGEVAADEQGGDYSGSSGFVED